MTDRPTLWVTGFGPFGKHAQNPSWDAVQDLKAKWNHDQVNIRIQEVPVSYQYVMDQMPQNFDDQCQPGDPVQAPLAIIHVGVSGIASKVILETRALNCGYQRRDVNEICPPGEKCSTNGCEELRTQFNVAQMVQSINEASQKTGVEAEESSDAGRYLCEFTFYKSLEAMKGKALFVHVPDFDQSYSIDQLGSTLLHISQLVLKQCDIKLK